MNTVLSSLPNAYRDAKEPCAILDKAQARKEVTDIMNVAARYGFRPLLKCAVERGYPLNPPNSKGSLFFALFGGDADLADFLRENGASVNHRFQKRCLLSHAAEKGHVFVVEYLLKYGALVDGFNSYSPLHWATKCKHREVAELLLRNGANPNQVGSKGKLSPKLPPLATALKNKDYEMILSLLRGGANPKGNGCYVSWDSGVHIKELMKEYKNKK